MVRIRFAFQNRMWHKWYQSLADCYLKRFSLILIDPFHLTLKDTHNHAHKATTWAHNTTRGVLYSNGAQVTISKNRMRENGVLVLRNDQGMLGCLLHAPRGLFYSPKAARSHWRQSGKAILAFCRVAHRTVRCTIGQALFMVWCRSPS
jgi:hypothetical protein